MGRQIFTADADHASTSVWKAGSKAGRAGKAKRKTRRVKATGL